MPIHTTKWFTHILDAHFILLPVLNTSAETSEIDIRKEMTKSISNNVKTKKAEEEQVTREIQEREENLIKESEMHP